MLKVQQNQILSSDPKPQLWIREGASAVSWLTQLKPWQCLSYWYDHAYTGLQGWEYLRGWPEVISEIEM